MRTKEMLRVQEMETCKDIEEVARKGRKQGGWITFPFIAGTMLGLSIASSGATSNMIVYLIKEYNVKSIDAAQINNIINGCSSLAPVAGAIISDAFFGCYPVVAFSTLVNLLSIVLFTLSATIKSLRPDQCTTGSINNQNCDHPSTLQLTVLYSAVALLSIAAGGTRFNLLTLGADQFDQIKDQDVFFNWFFVIMYASSIFGATVIVYIQDSVSWGLGFGICLVAGFVSVIVLMVGQTYYQRVKARGSPFTGLARVIVAAIRKRKIEVEEHGMNFYYGTVGGVKSMPQAPSRKCRFLNRAAIISEGDRDTDGNITKPWNLCTVEQVEDLKTLLRISPLWTSSISLSISIGIQLSLSILQALTMDRAISHRFSVPPGSVIVFSLTTVTLVLPIIDRILVPLCHKLTNWTPTPLQRLGLGHVFNTGAMAASALVEKRRSSIVHMHCANGKPDWVVPMSVLWLALPLAMAGLGEALHFPGQVALYYQEFPKSLRSTATGMIALIIAIGFYASTAVVGLVRKTTRWLPDNINDSKMDNVFWMLAVIGTINFGYYVLCATLYKYHSRKIQEEEAPVNNTNA